MSVDKQAEYSEKLTQARTELLNLLNSLSEEQLHTPVISEGQTWTPLDLVAHILENERGMSIHVHKIRNGRETIPEGFDLEQWNAGLKERAGTLPPLKEMLNELAQIRAKTLEVMGSLDDEEWGLQGRHPNQGMITIEQYYETMAGHDIWHANDIKNGLGLA